MFVCHNEGADLARDENWANLWAKVVALAADWGNRVHEPATLPQVGQSRRVSAHSDRLFPDWYVTRLDAPVTIDLDGLAKRLPRTAGINHDLKSNSVTITLPVSMSLYEAQHLWEARLYKSPTGKATGVVDVCLIGDSDSYPLRYSTNRLVRNDERFVRAQLQDLVKGL